MKKIFFVFSAFLPFAARAEWTQVQCVPDLERMGGTRGLLISAESCGNKKICQMLALCTMVDSDVLAKYGSFEKIPQEVVAKNTFTAGSGANCLADGNHCPDFKVCMGDDPDNKHYLDQTWDTPITNVTPSKGAEGMR